MRLVLALLGVLVAMPTVARAGTDVAIRLNSSGVELANALGVDRATLESTLADEVNNLYDDAHIAAFLDSFANATSFASRGIGVDYSPGFRFLELSIAANVGAAADGLRLDQDTAAGVAANLSFSAGLSLARLGLKRFRVYANGFSYGARFDNLQSSMPVDTVGGSLVGALTNVGLHAQYQLISPIRRRFVPLQWGGVNVTAGVELLRWTLRFQTPVADQSFVVQGAGGLESTIDASANTGVFDLSSQATTIPIEVTTGFRLLSILGIYGGGGVTFQLGSATADAHFKGDLNGTMPTTGERLKLGTASVTVDGAASPSGTTYHALAGIELRLWRLKSFVQASVVPYRGVAVGAGLRLAL